MKNKLTLSRLKTFVFIMSSFSIHALADVPLSYTGRLVNANGSPVTGPVDLTIDLAYINPDPLIAPDIKCSTPLDDVPLTNGVFHLKIDYTNAECGSTAVSAILANATLPVALRVTDRTVTLSPKVYSFQTIHAVPYAGVANFAKSIAQLGAVAGQVLSWNGTAWAPASAAGVGSVTSVGTGSGLTGGPITSSGSISIATGGITAAMLAQMGASTGNTLKWTGSAWAPSPDSGITSETDPSVQGWAKNTILPCNSDHTLKYDALLNSGAGGLFCSAIALDSDDVAEGSNLYFTDARARTAAVANGINNGTTDIAPAQDAVFDALALKQNLLSSSTNITVGTLQSSPTLAGSSGVEYGTRITPTVNQSSTAGYTALLMNVTETATGSGLKKLLDLQVGGVSKFSIDHDGVVTSSTSTQGTTASYTSASGNQLSVGYDNTNKTTINVDSLGLTTLSAAGTAAGFNFTGGNVGIGSPSPQFPLDVNGVVGIGSRMYMSRDGGGFSWIGARGTDAEPANLAVGFNSNSTGTVQWHQYMTAGLERMRITANGYVGIGLTTPSTALHVKAPSTDITVFRGEGSNADTRFRLDNFNTVSTSNQAGLDLAVMSNSQIRTASLIQSSLIDTTDATRTSQLRFSTFKNGSISTPLVIYGDNVGIGNQTPIHPLQVTGVIYASGEVAAQRFGMNTSGANPANGMYAPIGNSVAFATANIERVRIDPNGFVGIGTTNPRANLDSYAATFGSDGSYIGLGSYYGGTPQVWRNTMSSQGGSAIRNAAGAFTVHAGSSPGASTDLEMTDMLERFRISPNGNTGIGTSTPETKLDINGTQVLRGDSNGYGLFIPKFGTPVFGSNFDRFEIRLDPNNPLTELGNFHSGTGSPRTLAFVSGGSERMRIEPYGKVGIGTTNPIWPLQVNANNSAGQSGGMTLNTFENGTGTVGLGIRLSSSRGSAATPSNILNGDHLGSVVGSGYWSGKASSEFQNGEAKIGVSFVATEDWTSSSNNGNAMIFGTTLNGSGSQHERMRINHNGFVGIGTYSPDSSLHVEGGIRARGGIPGGNGINNNGYAFSSPGDNDSGMFSSADGVLEFYSNSSEIVRIANGRMGILNANPAYVLDVNGDINASGSVRSAGAVLTSDIRLKENLTPVTHNLEKLSTLSAYNYFWKDKKKFSAEKQLGLVAQEVQKVYPEAVSKGADGFFAVSYSNLVAPIIEAIKELKSNGSEADKKIQELQTENNLLKNRLDKLEKMMMKSTR